MVPDRKDANGRAGMIDDDCEAVLDGFIADLKQAWHWVVSFVTVLQVVARNSGVTEDSIGTADEWKRRHDAVRLAAEQAARRPAGVGSRHRKRPETDRPGGLYRAGSGEDVPHSEPSQMMQQAGGPRRRHTCRDAVPEWPDFYLYLESAAELVRSYEPRFVPGLLQVEAYARAVLAQSRPDADRTEIMRLVELRMRRQELLCQQGSFHLWAIFDKAALGNVRADPQTMRSQITHLINISEQPNVTLQVLLSPEPDDHVAIKDPITIFRFPEEHIDDVVFLEQPRGDLFLTDRKEIEHYNNIMSRLGIRAAGADQARCVLREIFIQT